MLPVWCGGRNLTCNTSLRLTVIFVCLCPVLCVQVFALGNKTYEHFNAMGKYVDKRLEELGATRVYDLGLGE